MKTAYMFPLWRIRKPFGVLLVFLVLITVVPAQYQETLTNESIVKMVQNRVSANIVIQEIQTSPGHYTLTADSLIQLKRQGVPDAVVAAMQAKTAKGTKSPANSTASASEATPPSPSAWITRSKEDALTGTKSVEASKVIALEGSASALVTASCSSDRFAEKLNESPAAMAKVMQGVMASVDPQDAPRLDSAKNLSLDTRVLEFRLLYRPEAGSGIGLLSSPVAQSVTPGPFGQNATISAPQSCVFMRVTVDGSGRDNVQSDNCGIPNLASTQFASFRMRDLTAAMMGGGGDNEGVNELASGLVTILAAGQDTTIALMKEALRSHEILIDLPLTDGNSALVALHPQEPDFRRFTSACLAAFPDPPVSRSQANAAPNEPSSKQPSGARGINFANTISEKDRLYSGSAEGFGTAFPGFVQRAAAVSGLNAKDYEKDIAYIIATIRTCAEITPEMAKKMKNMFDLKSLGSQYDVCRSLTAVSAQLAGRNFNAMSQRGLLLYLTPVGAWGDGQGFVAAVVVAPLPGDSSYNSSTHRITGDSMIVKATIHITPTATSNTYTTVPQTQPQSNSQPLTFGGTYDLQGVTTESQMLDVLDNSIWIPDGNAAEKQIYVIAGPCCDFSRALYQTSRNFAGKVQFRWVEMPATSEARCLGYLAETAQSTNPELLARMYQQMSEPRPTSTVIRENAIRWNRAVLVAINGMRKKLDPLHQSDVNYPILIWKSANGVKLAVRPDPNQVQAIVDSVVARFEAAHVDPASRRFLTRPYTIEQTAGVTYFAKEDNVKIYSLPDADSQPLFAIQARHGGARPIGQVKINGQVWLEFRNSGPDSWLPGFFMRADQVYQR